MQPGIGKAEMSGPRPWQGTMTVKTNSLAQQLHRASRTEAGMPREAWALARRLAGYLRHPRVGPCEELAFNRLEDGRVGVARFVCSPRGRFRAFAMISVGPAGLPHVVWNHLVQLAQTETVEMGLVMKNTPQRSTFTRGEWKVLSRALGAEIATALQKELAK
jgi:hypothetical protein